MVVSCLPLPLLRTRETSPTNSARSYSYAQRPLCAGHLALAPFDPGGRLAHGDGEGLERALRAVVVVVAPEAVHVQGDAPGLGEALQAVGDHLAAQIANLFAPEAQVDDREGPVGQVDHGAREGLVQRAVGVAKAGEARGRAERGGESVAQRYADVFGRVVVVDCVWW